MGMLIRAIVEKIEEDAEEKVAEAVESMGKFKPWKLQVLCHLSAMQAMTRV